jgi:predicted flap endonuclease-1-like 5' DNA nuclease
MQRNLFDLISNAEERADEGGMGRWFWLLAFLTLEILLIRWIMEMQREAARRARVVDQARRETAKGEHKAPIQKAAKPLPEPEEHKIPAPAQEDRLPQTEDFRRLEGIGPKVNALLHEAGMRTYSDLAESSAGQLREILRGANLYMMNPETWPEQAGLAAKGDWEALERLKNRLKGGGKA